MRGSTIAAALALVLVPAAQAGTGSQLFSQDCSRCHTLRAAGATGNNGPNLDQLRPSAGSVAAQVASGGGGMPSFGGSLSQLQISALAAYVASAAGGSSAPDTGIPGMSKTKVRTLQHALHKLGYFNGPFTGFYGQLTTAAVKHFQAAAGLTADGIWGPQSQSVLVKRLG
jgi:cytochrome c6